MLINNIKMVFKKMKTSYKKNNKIMFHSNLNKKSNSLNSSNINKNTGKVNLLMINKEIFIKHNKVNTKFLIEVS